MVITWEIPLLELRDEKATTYKLTKRLPQRGVAETKIYTTKREILKQIAAWLE